MNKLIILTSLWKFIDICFFVVLCFGLPERLSFLHSSFSLYFQIHTSLSASHLLYSVGLSLGFLILSSRLLGRWNMLEARPQWLLAISDSERPLGSSQFWEAGGRGLAAGLAGGGLPSEAILRSWGQPLRLMGSGYWSPDSLVWTSQTLVKGKDKEESPSPLILCQTSSSTLPSWSSCSSPASGLPELPFLLFFPSLYI